MKLKHQPKMLYILEVWTHVHIGENTEGNFILFFHLFKLYFLKNLIFFLKTSLFLDSITYVPPFPHRPSPLPPPQAFSTL